MDQILTPNVYRLQEGLLGFLQNEKTACLIFFLHFRKNAWILYIFSVSILALENNKQDSKER